MKFVQAIYKTYQFIFIQWNINFQFVRFQSTATQYLVPNGSVLYLS